MHWTNSFVCTLCGDIYPLDTRDWHCACGGMFDLNTCPRFEMAAIDASREGLWRYGALFPLDPTWEPVTLGEGGTPLVPVEYQGWNLLLKLESVSPTGSFKDRGAALLVTALRALGIRRVVEDSSGNAGASLAAYAARAGIACEVCVPCTLSGPKLAQVAAYGAEVVEIKGKREYAALAAWAAAAHGAYYASHVYNPYYLAGIETIAFELWEALAYQAPDFILLPVGNGSLLLGIYRGFRRLHDSGLVARLPRLIAVQAAACAPIYSAFVSGLDTVPPVTPEPTIASGVAVSQPARGAEILAAVRATSGHVFAVAEKEIAHASNQLARQGFYVEETSAVSVAALTAMKDVLPASGAGMVVVLLTGHGLKTAARR